MIAAMSSNRVIGKDNKLPRYLPEDLKRFKDITAGETVLMWRQTFESIWKPLPWRDNVVISRTTEFPWVRNFNDPEIAFEALKSELGEQDELYIIWWATLYSYFLERTERLYLTEIKSVYQGDTFFPAFEEKFEEVERTPHGEYDFVMYRKKWVE